MTPLLSVDLLGKTYQSKKWIFRNLSFSLEKGDIVHLAGPNGCGKTTLIRILSSALSPSEGDIRLWGKICTDRPQILKSSVGWAESQMGFYPQMSGLENLKIFSILNRTKKNDFENLLAAWKPFATFQEALSSTYGLSSNGMRQSLSLFLAFSKKPQILLLDECHNGLDQKSVTFLNHQIQAHSQNGLCLMSSHSPTTVEAVCTRRIEL